jgi:hypothetical protein
MIEDVLIRKLVAEHQPLQKSQLEPGILDRDVALIAPSPGILTQAELQMR